MGNKYGEKLKAEEEKGGNVGESAEGASRGAHILCQTTSAGATCRPQLPADAIWTGSREWLPGGSPWHPLKRPELGSHFLASVHPNSSS